MFVVFETFSVVFFLKRHEFCLRIIYFVLQFRTTLFKMKNYQSRGEFLNIYSEFSCVSYLWVMNALIIFFYRGAYTFWCYHLFVVAVISESCFKISLFSLDLLSIAISWLIIFKSILQNGRFGGQKSHWHTQTVTQQRTRENNRYRAAMWW